MTDTGQPPQQLRAETTPCAVIRLGAILDTDTDKLMTCIKTPIQRAIFHVDAVDMNFLLFACFAFRQPK